MCRALGSSRTREKEPCDRVLSLPCGFHIGSVTAESCNRTARLDKSGKLRSTLRCLRCLPRLRSPAQCLARIMCRMLLLIFPPRCCLALRTRKVRLGELNGHPSGAQSLSTLSQKSRLTRISLRPLLLAVCCGPCPFKDEASSGEICAAVMFDMTFSDSDAKWTYVPDAVDHLRVVESHVNFGDLEIILDSRTDGSALPLSHAQVGSPSFSNESCALLMLKVFL